MPTPLPEPEFPRTEPGADFMKNYLAAQETQKANALRQAEYERKVAHDNILAELTKEQVVKARNDNALFAYKEKQEKLKTEQDDRKDVVNKFKLLGSLQDSKQFEAGYNAFIDLLSRYGVDKSIFVPVDTFLVKDKTGKVSGFNSDRYKTYMDDMDRAVGNIPATHKIDEKVEWIIGDSGKPERWMFVNRNGSWVKHKQLAMSPKEEAELGKIKAETEKARRIDNEGKFDRVTYYGPDGRVISQSVRKGETVSFDPGSRLASEEPTEKRLTPKEVLEKERMLLDQPESADLSLEADVLNKQRGTNKFWLPTDVQYRNKMVGTGINTGIKTEKWYKPITIPKDPKTGMYRPYSYFEDIATKRNMTVGDVIKEYNKYVATVGKK